MSLSNILNKITGPRVEFVGWIGAIASTLFYGKGFTALTVLVLLGFFALTVESAKFRDLLTKTIGKFAKVPAWPLYVSAGVTILLAAHQRGGLITIAFVLAMGVGVLFNELY